MGGERIIPAPPRSRKREGAILHEVPNVLGLVLWQDLRHLRDWTESAPEVRTKLFKPPTAEVLAKRRDARACAGEIAPSLDTFAAMRADPVNADPSDLGAACEKIVEWALEREYTQAAVEFAEAGATVDPSNPKRANIAGRLTRDVCEYERAEDWFKRGIGLARSQRDTIEKFWGHVGYGKLCKEIGRVKDARKHLNRASRLAWKAGPPTLAASAQHDICALLMVRGYLAEAAQHARLALHWYPQSDPRLPFFGADAALMLVLGRRYAAAARVLRPVLRAVQQPSARAVVFALAARAYAGAGEAEEAAVMRKRALKLLHKHPSLEAVARWHLADALRLAGNWEGAQAEAEAALAIATTQNDGETARMNRMLLGLIARRQPAPPRSATDVRDFVQKLTERVAHWSPRRGRQPGPWGVGRAA